MRDRLDGIGVFVEVVQAGSFAAAAARLHLSRSAVGKSIARLESRLGVRLFHRTTRTQSLTEDGTAYYERCLRALDEIRAGEAMLESGRREAVGRLRVSVPSLFGRHCVAPVLTALARGHPRLELEIGFTDRVVDLVEEGFDLAVRNAPLADAPVLTARRIARQLMVVCAAPAYVEARGAPEALAELPEHEVVAYWRTGEVKPWWFPTADGPPAAVTLRSRYRLDDIEAIAEAAVAGLGLAWLPEWLVRDRLRSGDLVLVLDRQPGIAFDTFAVWPQTPHLPMRVRLAIDALAAGVPKLAGV